MSALEIVDLADCAAGATQLTLASDGTPENPLVLVDLSSPTAPPPPAGLSGVVVGITDGPDRPAPRWLTTVASPDEVDDIAATVLASPRASVVLAQLVADSASTDVWNGLLAESLSYSMLLGSSEFRAWRESTPRHPAEPPPEPVLLERDRGCLSVTLNRPERHNAFSAAVRNGLLEALALAEADESVTTVRLTGAGPSFSSGGDLDEFGSATDPAGAHIVRLAASAGWAVYRLRDRVRPILHGACLGAGIEVSAFADHVVAQDDAYFGLPELRFGLVPGAGGTVSLRRRIGGQRTAWLALTGRHIDVGTALRWGLIDERAG